MAKKTKEETNYRAATQWRHSCGTCKYFRRDSASCTKVEGEIRAKDYCNLWEASMKRPLAKTRKLGLNFFEGDAVLRLDDPFRVGVVEVMSLDGRVWVHWDDGDDTEELPENLELYEGQAQQRADEVAGIGMAFARKNAKCDVCGKDVGVAWQVGEELVRAPTNILGGFLCQGDYEIIAVDPEMGQLFRHMEEQMPAIQDAEKAKMLPCPEHGDESEYLGSYASFPSGYSEYKCPQGHRFRVKPGTTREQIEEHRKQSKELETAGGQ